MSSFGNPSALGFFPVTAVEEAGWLEAGPVDIVETTRVDCDSVGFGPRDVERVHSAMRAECVLGHPGAKRIGCQQVLATQQFKILRRHRQVQDALLCADGAAALRQQVQIDLGAEADSAAMAATLAMLSIVYTPSTGSQSESSGGWRFVQPVASS